MFVSVVLDPGGADSSRALISLLAQYGFTRIQRACWENTAVSEKRLRTLKKDIDRVTDFYDRIRIYQYPVKGLMAITELSKKKWRRCMLRPQPD
ncbi:CRISPR-associated protein Cas2 [Treponema sp. OMZ 840]|uniref:CRISPR-associated protein Cas2 n=1 Tax=Treponema sp. OMZ 840 TaxID=244313 RepID=UPI003D91ECD6